MISKEERERDKGICEAATPEWIVVQPRSQEGGPTLGHTGPSFGNTFPAATSFRAATGDPFDALSWEQHAANGAAAVTGRNRLPLYIADAEEMDRRIGALANIANDPETNHATASVLLRAVRILRGET